MFGLQNYGENIMPIRESEFRLYNLISSKLEELGWDTKSPFRGGQVYTQSEALKNDKLKEALGLGRPENIVVIEGGKHWVIEAKARLQDLYKAVEEAKTRAGQINTVQGISCPIITGVAGNPDTTYYVETLCLVGKVWNPLVINGRQSTGFISPAQVKEVLLSGDAELREYEINDKLFSTKIGEINETLHNGAIHKKSRAEVLACLLLALANDKQMQLNDDPTTLINDINGRARGELRKYGKEEFFKEIEIHPPTSADNHIKNKNALVKSIEKLKDINIASAINSGRDVLGQCYEEFLKYANDAKEIGIVLTPRHITKFGAEIIDIQKKDVVFDPTCGTGGFLVAALDKVRKDGGNIDNFKKGNLYGVEQDALIATLAIINMVFRGDGSSQIKEGDCFKKQMPKKSHKVLMNPPFALKNEFEWQFVDKAIENMHEGGLLFAVLPTSTMNASNDRRGEITWRRNLIKQHTLIAVIKLAEELFYPQVSKGTYGVIVKAHRPRDTNDDRVIWAILNDGVVRTKTQTTKKSNIEEIIKAVKNYIATRTEPMYIPEQLDCSPVASSNTMDLSPEHYIGKNRRIGSFNVYSVQKSIGDAQQLIKFSLKAAHKPVKQCSIFPLSSFFSTLEKGKSGREKEMQSGKLPLISTSEKNNGISAMVNEKSVKKIYCRRGITISANGSSCCAHYHDYEFAANADVYVGQLKKEFNKEFFGIFLCAAINNESWRFNYYRKLSHKQLESLTIKVPADKNGKVDFRLIQKIVQEG